MGSATGQTVGRLELSEIELGFTVTDASFRGRGRLRMDEC